LNSVRSVGFIVIAIAIAGCSGGSGAGGGMDASAAGGAGGSSAPDAAAAADASDALATPDGADGPVDSPPHDVALDVPPADAPPADAPPADVPASTDGGAADAPAGDAPAGDAPDAPVLPAVPYPYLVSGTRLRVNTIQGADGTVVQMGLHDTQVGADCNFAQDAAGVVRCMPAGDAEILFQDAACATTVAVINPCVPAQWGPLYRAGGRRDQYKVGAAITRPAGLWRLEETSSGVESCVPEERTLPSTSTFAAADLWPAASFVAATESVETRPGLRLGARYIVGADGSKVRGAVTDAVFGLNCDVLPASDGTTRCFPDDVEFTPPAFADDRCTEPLAVLNGSVVPRYVRFRGAPPAQASCAGGLAWTMREVMAVYQGSVWNGANGTCVPATSPTTRVYHRLGPDVSGAMLATLTTELRGGGSRLGGLASRGSDGSIYEPGRPDLVDSRFMELCVFTPVAGGPLRCLPPFTPSPYGFADAACQMRAYMFVDQRCTYPGAAAAHRTAFMEGECGDGPATAVFARGAPVTSSFDLDSTATCSPRTLTVDRLYVDGPAVALAEFVSGEARRE
jgi:hypothetical protein